MPPEIDRRASDPWRIKIESEITSIKTNVDQNTTITLDTKAKVDEVHSVLKTIEGALKAFGWIATAAKYIGMLVGGIAAVWFAFKSGGEVPKIDIPK